MGRRKTYRATLEYSSGCGVTYSCLHSNSCLLRGIKLSAGLSKRGISLSDGKKLMFQFVDDLDKRGDRIAYTQRPTLEEYILTGSCESASNLLCCGCQVCKDYFSRDLPQKIISTAHMVEHAYRIVVRIINSSNFKSKNGY